MYQPPFEGRYTEISVLPSPSKSPSTGRSPMRPHAWLTYVVYFVLESRMYQEPFDGRYTATSVLSSPSKSPEAPKIAHIRRVVCSRLRDLPAAIRGAVHRDVGPAVAAVICSYRDVAGGAPQVAHVRRVVRAREQDVPAGARRAI